jgi:hypothetical protein
MITENDIEDFFISDDWSEEVTYKGKKVEAIFDNESSPINFGEISVQSTQPKITGKESDFADAKNGEPIIIRGNTFYITDKQPSGTGIIEVMLSKKSPQI